MTRGDPGNLQFQIALVAPEPGDFVIGRRMAGYVGGHASALVDGVLHRFEAHSAHRERCGKVGAVADRQDPRVESDQAFVDDDAVVDSETRLAGEFGIGNDPNADKDEVGGEPPAVGRLDAGHPAAGAENAGHAGAERNLGTPAAMGVGEEP